MRSQYRISTIFIRPVINRFLSRPNRPFIHRCIPNINRSFNKTYYTYPNQTNIFRQSTPLTRNFCTANKDLKIEAFKCYTGALTFEDFDESPEEIINRAFALLAVSKSMNWDRALESFDEAEDKIREIEEHLHSKNDEGLKILRKHSYDERIKEALDKLQKNMKVLSITEYSNKKACMESIDSGREMIEAIKKGEPHLKNTYHFFRTDGTHISFDCKELGYQKIEGAMSLVG